ncbi:MAG: methyltransferase domain-containing protein [Planctomycetota bacterium]
MAPAGDERLYEGLARYQWLLRRLRRAPPGVDLEMHKRLAAPAPGQPGPLPGDAWHDWVWRQLELGEAPRVVDLGCGFGASVLRWARAHRGTFVGLGNSSYQLARARGEAERLGLSARCSFRPNAHGTTIEGSFDGVVAVETLVHATDLTGALVAVAACMAPGGRFVSMEDVARDADVGSSPHARQLAAAWALGSLWSTDDWDRAARAAGLRVVRSIDLTDQVIVRPEATLARSERRLRRLRRLLPGRHARSALDAFLGGIAMERLYRDGMLAYRCAVLERRDDA